ncbi:hypothetical protein [Dyadobacter tibetensis]|uniref:hypothetical protein n=1 Tax=Dyadobacter tibetensis TaxID=1211851 RepID=UPI00047140F9|nr:hypothetical protein [Dyadobacter tibetensis]
MRLTILLALALLLTATESKACDACGCANSGSYFGLMPQSNKSLIGLRYQQIQFTAHPESRVLQTKENFEVAELYTRFFPIKRVQVLAFLPYRLSQQTTTSETKKQNGLGDASILVNYNIINTFMDTESNAAFTHTLLVGGGVKLPTGRFKYNEDDLTDVANPNFQSGTGSTDFMINAFYTLNYQQWGLATNISRKFNTTNREDYKFGDQLYGTIDLYRSILIKKLTVTPHIGVYGEKSQLGSRAGVEIRETGGTLINGTLGLTLFAERWTLGVSAQKPLAQDLSDGYVLAKPRGLIQLGFLF